MKLGVVILLGAADVPHESRDGRTPLEAARMPAVARLAEEGRVGGVTTIPRRTAPSSEAALAALFGAETPPAAGPLLAGALGVEIGPDETAFRCDFVNLYGGTVVDPTGGRLGGREAEILAKALADELDGDRVRFVPGLRWRGLLVTSAEKAGETRTTAPALFFGEPLKEHLPRRGAAALLREHMERAGAVLGEHEINSVRVDLGENPANGIWIWGGGRPTGIGSLAGGRGIAVGGHPSFLGLARAAGLELRPVSARTDPIEDPGVVGAAAVEALTESDLVVTALEGASVLSRFGDPDGKAAYLEAVDSAVVRPLAERLVDGGEGRLLVVAGHVADSELRRDAHGTVPFVVAGPGTATYGDAAFTEAAACAADLQVEKGWELLEYAGRP